MSDKKLTEEKKINRDVVDISLDGSLFRFQIESTDAIFGLNLIPADNSIIEKTFKRSKKGGKSGENELVSLIADHCTGWKDLRVEGKETFDRDTFKRFLSYAMTMSVKSLDSIPEKDEDGETVDTKFVPFLHACLSIISDFGNFVKN